MKKLLTILVLLPLTITAAPTQPFNALGWDDTQTVDGYRLYCDTAPFVDDGRGHTYQTPNGTTQGATFAEIGLADGNWYCSVTAFNVAGESPYSVAVNFTLVNGAVPLAGVPNAPFNLRLQ